MISKQFQNWIKDIDSKWIDLSDKEHMGVIDFSDDVNDFVIWKRLEWPIRWDAAKGECKKLGNGFGLMNWMNKEAMSIMADILWTERRDVQHKYNDVNYYYIGAQLNRVRLENGNFEVQPQFINGNKPVDTDLVSSKAKSSNKWIQGSELGLRLELDGTGGIEPPNRLLERGILCTCHDRALGCGSYVTSD